MCHLKVPTHCAMSYMLQISTNLLNLSWNSIIFRTHTSIMFRMRDSFPLATLRCLLIWARCVISMMCCSVSCFWGVSALHCDATREMALCKIMTSWSTMCGRESSLFPMVGLMWLLERTPDCEIILSIVTETVPLCSCDVTKLRCSLVTNKLRNLISRV